MNDVARAQLIFQMLTLLQNHPQVSHWLWANIVSKTSQQEGGIYQIKTQGSDEAFFFLM